MRADRWTIEVYNLVGRAPMSALGIRLCCKPQNGTVEIAGPERAPFNEIVARYLKAVGDPREVASDFEARYFGSRVEEYSLVPLGEARLGRIGFDEWLRRSKARS